MNREKMQKTMATIQKKISGGGGLKQQVNTDFEALAIDWSRLYWIMTADVADSAFGGAVYLTCLKHILRINTIQK